MNLWKTSFVVLTCAYIVGCSGQGTQEESISALRSCEDFRDARNSLAAVAIQHANNVMEQSSLSSMTRDEVRFHDHSTDVLADMDWSLRLMAQCKNAAGETLATDGARAALRDLRKELENHKMGMLTVVDQMTAHAAELVFDGRQSILLEELDAYRAEFELVADQYDCAF